MCGVASEAKEGPTDGRVGMGEVGGSYLEREDSLILNDPVLVRDDSLSLTLGVGKIRPLLVRLDSLLDLPKAPREESLGLLATVAELVSYLLLLILLELSEMPFSM